MQYRNEAQPDPSHDDLMAMKVWNFLANGMGGLDWSGLPLAVASFGITDIDGLLHRLQIIKAHKPPNDGQPAQT